MALSLSGRGHSIDRHGIITNCARAFYTDRLVIDTNWTRPFIDRHGVITNLTRHSSERLGIITNWTRAFYWQTWRYYLECHVGRQNVLLSLIETSELHVVQMDGMIWKSFLHAIRARFNDVVKDCRSNILRYQVYWGLAHQKQIAIPGQVITSYDILSLPLIPASGTQVLNYPNIYALTITLSSKPLIHILSHSGLSTIVRPIALWFE